MSRTLTLDSTLENFRKEAKRWLKALRAGDVGARRRLLATTPAAPADPGLRDIQLALAREFGFPGWAALQHALDELAHARRSLAERVDIVLRSVMWQADRTVASRILARFPEIGAANLYTAVSTGNLAELERRLVADPAAANRKGGARDREPLLYLAYARLPGSELHGLEMAEALLDRGADPNASWTGAWGPPPFTVLTGVIGEGAGVQPPHPPGKGPRRSVDRSRRRPLRPAGALQHLNRRRRGRLEAWRAVPEFSKIGGAFELNALDYLLGNAVAANHLRRAEWLLAHGANANSLHAYAKRLQREEALIQGHEEMADLLIRHGGRQRRRSPERLPSGPRA